MQTCTWTADVLLYVLQSGVYVDGRIPNIVLENKVAISRQTEEELLCCIKLNNKKKLEKENCVCVTESKTMDVEHSTYIHTSTQNKHPVCFSCANAVVHRVHIWQTLTKFTSCVPWLILDLSF